MRNCLILGAGRSGTSMVAGTLSKCGYFMGENLHRARASNPKGFFEDREVNMINEAILAPITPSFPRLTKPQRWLSKISTTALISVKPYETARIKKLVQRSPYCYKDPRFCYTLSGWRKYLQDTNYICIFRHPVITALSMLEECDQAPYLRDVSIDFNYALDVWAVMYRRILEEHCKEGNWLFLHYEQALKSRGMQKIDEFLGVKVDRNFPDRHLIRKVPDRSLNENTYDLYRHLCTLAEYDEPSSKKRIMSDVVPNDVSREQSIVKPHVSVFMVVEDNFLSKVEGAVNELRQQRNVIVEVLLIDQTKSGCPELKDTVIVRDSMYNRALAYKRACEISKGEYIAWHDPRCQLLKNRFAVQCQYLIDNEHIEMVTSNFHLTNQSYEFIDKVLPLYNKLIAPAFWHSSVMVRKNAMRRMVNYNFFPVEVDLLLQLNKENLVQNINEGLVTVDKDQYEQLAETADKDFKFICQYRLSRIMKKPLISVVICTYNRLPILISCLESFCRQQTIPGSFELIIVDDGSNDGTRKWLQKNEFPVPVKIKHQKNLGLAAARNTALKMVSGDLTLFVNDDTIAFLDLVNQHLKCHEKYKGEKLMVLGTFEQPKPHMENVLIRYLEKSTEVFNYAFLQPMTLYNGMHFYTCNISVPTKAVIEAGAFDESFKHYGCEDTDLGIRLEKVGYRVLYNEKARALHSHFMDFDQLRKRQRTVAKAYVRFFMKHPFCMQLKNWKNTSSLTTKWCQARLNECKETINIIEEYAREISAKNVENIDQEGYHEVDNQTLERLSRIIPDLNKIWWLQGYLDGFKEQGLKGFKELIPAKMVLTWPKWNESDDLTKLFEEIALPLAGQNVNLCLRYDPEVDGDYESIKAELIRIKQKCRLKSNDDLSVYLFNKTIHPRDWAIYFEKIDAQIVLPSYNGADRAIFSESINVTRLTSASEVTEWLYCQKIDKRKVKQCCKSEFRGFDTYPFEMF